MKRNEGEVPQYYVEGSHSPIVGAALFDHVQEEMRRRKGIGNIAGASCFSGRIVCGDCGSVYGRKLWHSTSKYCRVVWQCNGKFKGAEKCSTPHLYEKDIKRMILDFVNGLIMDRKEILGGLKESLAFITDNTDLEKERGGLQDECEVVMELMRKMVQVNTRVSQDQADYNARYSGMTARYDKAIKRLMEVKEDITAHSAKRSKLECFLKLLDSRDDLLTEFDEGLWLGIVHQMKVHADGNFTFTLKDSR